MEDGYLARKILTIEFSLVNLFDEFHPYSVIFSNVVERLVRRRVVHEAALALDSKREWVVLREELFLPQSGRSRFRKVPEATQLRDSRSIPTIHSLTQLGLSGKRNRNACVGTVLA